jgi:formylglycine-generating enzyme required for sulfatase activity
MKTRFGILGLGLLLVVSACAATGMTIPDAKQLPDNQPVTLSGNVVTYATTDFFYIEEDSRCMGVRVERPAHGLTVGMRADVPGDTKTNSDGERYILASSAAHSGDGEITPVGMNNRAVGGADWQVVGTGGQRGVTAGVGLNNIGLLVRAWGRYHQVDATAFTLDDGSGLNIKCTVKPGVLLSPGWQYVAVIGVSSLFYESTAYFPVILVRDIQVIAINYPGQMIYIPAGSFDMGTPDSYTASHNSVEHPQHSVALSGYYIGRYEVTRGEYRAFVNAGGYSTRSYWSADGWSWKLSSGRTEPNYWPAPENWGNPPGPFTQTDNHPVVGVSYYEAEAFCNWAGGHLPTEAQWERAARWNSTTNHANVYPWGDTWDQQRCNNSNDSLYPGSQTAPVGSYYSYSSPSGCQDMAGNVWEWCKDWYDTTYYSTSPPSDPQGPASGSHRVQRGSAWGGNDYSSRCACRVSDDPYNGWNNYGFRLAR